MAAHCATVEARLRERWAVAAAAAAEAEACAAAARDAKEDLLRARAEEAAAAVKSARVRDDVRRGGCRQRGAVRAAPSGGVDVPRAFTPPRPDGACDDTPFVSGLLVHILGLSLG